MQHEYGLFGGPAGSHLLKLLGDLRMPVVTTLHTVLKDPAPEYRAVMSKLSDLSDATEMLAEGRGRIVLFRNPDAVAEQIIDLLDNDVERHAMRKKAYTFSRESV